MTYSPIAPTGREATTPGTHDRGKPRPPRVRRGQGRDELISSALALTAARGMHSVRLRSVTQRAGLSLGSATYHFDTREDLLRAALDAHTALALRGVDSARERARAASSPAAAHRELLAALTDWYCDRDAAVIRSEIYLEAARDDAVAAIALRNRGAAEALLADLYRTRGRPAERAAQDGAAAAAALDYAAVNAFGAAADRFAATMRARVAAIVDAA